MSDSGKLLARIKPGKKGFVVQRYMFGGTLYVATRGWYEVNEATASQLKGLHHDDTDPDSPKVFQVVTHEEAQQIEEQEAEQAERASASRPNRATGAGISGRVVTERQRQRGGDLSTSDLPGNQKEEEPAMLDPDPEGAELKGPDEQDGIAPIGRVTPKEETPTRTPAAAAKDESEEPQRSTTGRRAAGKK